MVKDGTTEYGLLRWEVEDDNARIEVNFETNREREAIDIVQNREGYKAAPGEWLRPVIKHQFWTPEDGTPEPPFQTRGEWIEKMIKAEQNEKPTID